MALARAGYGRVEQRMVRYEAVKLDWHKTVQVLE